MRELTPKFVIGVNYSHNSGMSSRRGRNSGSILYLNEFGQQSLPDYTKYGIDFLFAPETTFCTSVYSIDKHGIRIRRYPEAFSYSRAAIRRNASASSTIGWRYNPPDAKNS